jgi:glycosyltransferase involved in cell wall biosynthesis
VRIAIITSGYLPGVDGTTIVVHERSRLLSQWGHDVLIVGPDYEPIARYFPNWKAHQGEVLPRVTSVSVPCKTFFGVEWEQNPTPAAFRHLSEHLERFRPDIIHVDEPERLTYGYLRRPGLAYARRHNIPCVAFYHTNYVEYGPDFIPLPGPAMRLLQAIVEPCIASIYNAYDATLVPGQTTADKLRRVGFRNMIFDAFNGVDHRRFSSAVPDATFLEQRFGLRGLRDRIKILMVGRLTPDKGWAFAIKALPALAARVGAERIAILVAGAGELEESVQASLDGSGVRAHLLGRVPPDEIAQVYANVDLYVSCSQKETWGLTAAEANAAGLPAITPRAGGFLDQISDGVNGAMYHPEDVEDFAQVVGRFVEDRELRTRCGVEGRRSSAAYDWPVVIRRWLDAVTSVRPVAER